MFRGTDANRGRQRKRTNANATPSTVQSAFGVLDRYNCNVPLLAIDMVGMWKRFDKYQYGLCDYCGRMCVVINENITTRGLSCGRHPLAEYPRYHRIWRQLGNLVKGGHIPGPLVNPADDPHDIGLNTFYPNTPHPKPPNCFACSPTRPDVAKYLMNVYDSEYRVTQIPLCFSHGMKAYDYANKLINTPSEKFKEIPISVHTLIAVARNIKRLVTYRKK